jgi:predicted porin
VSWIPWSRLNLQAGLNYVWSITTTPASDYTQAVLDAQNNYWTVNFSSTFVIDDRTDLNLGYLYYRADNYKDNSSSGVPYGAGAEEHSVSVGVARRIRNNIRLFVRYGYHLYTDETFAGNEDYHVHVVSCSVRYLF